MIKDGSVLSVRQAVSTPLLGVTGGSGRLRHGVNDEQAESVNNNTMNTNLRIRMTAYLCAMVQPDTIRPIPAIASSNPAHSSPDNELLSTRLSHSTETTTYTAPYAAYTWPVATGCRDRKSTR